MSYSFSVRRQATYAEKGLCGQLVVLQVMSNEKGIYVPTFLCSNFGVMCPALMTCYKVNEETL